MTFVVRSRSGSTLTDPEPAEIANVLVELDEPLDPSNATISLTHESGWKLTAYHSGLLVFENLESEHQPPRHLRGVSRELVAGLWASLACGDIDTLEAQHWRHGRGLS